MAVIPFLKWPGGKRWFITHHADLLPTKFGTYFEPFLGGGSVFFYLQPERAVLADRIAELIEVYKAVAWSRNRLEALLKQHQIFHGNEYYYKIRGSTPDYWVQRAARTLYLNRTCFNGMYRVNFAGQFNVPKGTKTAVLLDTDNFVEVARLLRRAELRVSDFGPIIDRSKTGDFVFADPPYIVGHNENGFVRYNDKLFKWADQVRLADTLLKARERGVIVVATNAAHPAVEELYRDRGFSLTRVERYTSIFGSKVSRSRFQEFIIRANCPERLPWLANHPTLNPLSKKQVTKETHSTN